MTTSDKFQRLSFKVAFKLTAKSVRSHILTFGIFENRIAGLGSCEDSIIGAGAGAAGAGTFCPEPEPEPEPPNSFTRSRSRSRNAAPEPEPECRPGAGAGAGADQIFHGSASILHPYPYASASVLRHVLVNTHIFLLHFKESLVIKSSLKIHIHISLFPFSVCVSTLRERRIDLIVSERQLEMKSFMFQKFDF